MFEPAGPTTQPELVAAAYAKFASVAVARTARSTVDVRRKDLVRPCRRCPVGRRGARHRLRRLPPRPGRHAGRARAGRAPAVHARRTLHHRGPGHRALRSSDPGARRSRRRSGRGGRREPRGLRVPRRRMREVRHRFLEARKRDHPSGRARELRVPRRHDDRHRLAHAERGWPRDDRGRCRRR